MKILEIKQTDIGEVAYIYDEQEGKIVKVLIEDRTGYGEVEEEEVLSVYKPKKKIKKRIVREEPIEEDYSESDQVKESIHLGKPRMAIVNDELIVTREPLPPKARGNIMPPGIRSVFLPHDTPGSAIEKRVV